MLNGCHASVQQLASQATRSQSNQYEQRLSSNVVQATASALQDLTIKFRKCQSNYLHSEWAVSHRTTSRTRKTIGRNSDMAGELLPLFRSWISETLEFYARRVDRIATNRLSTVSAGATNWLSTQPPVVHWPVAYIKQSEASSSLICSSRRLTQPGDHLSTAVFRIEISQGKL